MKGRHAAVVALGVAALSGCAGTTYDATIATGTVVVTTTTLPSGTTAELLQRMVTESAGLSELIANGGDDEPVADRIASLWAAAQQDVGKNRPEMLGNFQASVERIQRAVKYSRPADADKTYRSLKALVESYLAG